MTAEPIDLCVLWSLVHTRLERELGEVGGSPRLLSPPWSSRATWAVSASSVGELVVKVRHGDRACEKTGWCVENLPRLAARGYPLPVILWHGMLDEERHVVVQRRLAGRPLRWLTWPLLDQLLALVELQADADAAPTSEERDFADYIANVLFEDWDEVWPDAAAAGSGAGALCARVRGWLEPIWGLRLPARDFTHNDLNLSNILSDGERITGVVDWDEFGLGCRAIDLVTLAFDCERNREREMSDHLLARGAEIAGSRGLRCLVSYRAIALLADNARESKDSRSDVATIEEILTRHQGHDR